jgi:hypothetical protein
MIILMLACTSEEILSDTGQAVADTPVDAQFRVLWTAEQLEIGVENGESGSWWFGIAETADFVTDPWTGEDCHLGDLLEDNTQVLWCHPLSQTGGTLTFGGDPSALLTGQETAMNALGWASEPMYYFLDLISGNCHLGGPGAGKYTELCENIIAITVENPAQ